MSSRELAERAVKGIADQWGYVGDELLNGIDPSTRRRIEQLLMNKDKKLSHAINTLAKNLYGSGARFVFELLQNADDNRFARANSQGHVPFISFSVYPDRIIVDCNEDGFTKRDLESICSVGESTKSTSHGYIGAKGIGFKSVFIAARKVHIQSGHFSFYFKHEPDDPGLGMVVPVWQDPQQELPSPLTRMVLELHRGEMMEGIDHLRKTIFEQLDALDHTCLLFLRNLRQISVSFYNNRGDLEKSKSFQVGGVNKQIVSINTLSTGQGGEQKSQEQLFHVTRHSATGLSKSQNRELPDTAEARKASSTAEVVLVFPLTLEHKPLVKRQDVFAFLPVRETEYNFIIQSDFDTSANRQDIVTTSLRNRDLLKHIATAFVTAVLQFCDHQTLCYTWPSFLPSPDHGSNTLWSELNREIKELVLRTPVLRSRREDLGKISHVRILTADFQDENGDPLLDSPAQLPFLSPKYGNEAVDDLKKCGLQALSAETVLQLVRYDLQKDASSRIKSRLATEEWHSTLAKYLTTVEPGKFLQQLKNLPLIPLRDGPWVSASSSSVYLPMTGHLVIPHLVGSHIVDDTAAANSHRKSFFTKIGCFSLPPGKVRDLLLKSYHSSSQHCRSFNPSQSRAHLHFLYLTESTSTTKTKASNELKSVWLYDDSRIPRFPQNTDVYLPDGHLFGANALFEATEDAPGIQAAFINPMYLEKTPSSPDSSHPSWQRWLTDRLGLRDKPRLVSRNGSRLSDSWSHVAKHKPKKLLGMLEYLWESEKGFLTTELEAQIKNTSVTELCESPLPGDCSLSQAYLPLSDIRAQCHRFMDSNDPFPFLALGTTSSSEIAAKWTFLTTDLDVKRTVDLSFLLDVLHWIKEANEKASTISNPRQLLNLYIAIQAQCLGADDSRTKTDQVINRFTASKCIYVPAHDGHNARWAEPDSCLWRAPPNMKSKASLAYLYGPLLDADKTQPLEQFFEHSLKIRDVTWNELMHELEVMKDDPCEDFDHIVNLYKELDKMRKSRVATDGQLRTAFARSPLIYVGTDSSPNWYNTSDCLWSSASKIRGKATLQHLYGDLEDFFVSGLGVELLTIQMVYDDLLRTDQKAPIDEVRSKIWTFNGFLQSEPDFKDSQGRSLLDAWVFPVKCQNHPAVLRTAKDEFAITDRQELEDWFNGQISLLDYSLADVRRLKPFLEWAQLTDRYLSVSVRELTSVADGSTRPISKRNRSLREKSHSILRIAATFNSPRYGTDANGLYDQLRMMKVVETDDIASILTLSQQGKQIRVTKDRADMHISEEPTGLAIFVPSDATKQEFCFTLPLPHALEDWLMREPKTQTRQGKISSSAVSAIAAVISTHQSAVQHVLDHQGIVQIPIEEIPIKETSTGEISIEANPEGLQIGLDLTQNAPQITTAQFQDPTALFPSDSPGPVFEQLTQEISIPEVSLGITPEQAAAQQALTIRSRTLPVVSHPLTSAVNTAYQKLLIQVVEAARSANFPINGESNAAQSSSLVLAADTGFYSRSYDGADASQTSRFRPNSSPNYDVMIGAAGELYAFELLRSLSPALPSFTLSNWPSTIRHLASAHPDHADIRPWTGFEDADIAYDDSDGVLTRLLIERGYLEAESRGATPRYLFEVKTTTGPCEGPFYMSRKQVARMRGVHDKGMGQGEEVYVVLRVFGVGGDGIGLRVYLDPERLKTKGELVFTAEKWAVVPGGGAE